MAFLDVRNLSTVLGEPAREVLLDIDLSFEKGTITLLLGSNGSGKSVLLRSILGLIPANTGEIFLQGCSLRRRFGDLYKNSGVVFQNPDQQLFGATVLEDLEIGLTRGETPDPEVISDLGIHDLLERAPVELSGGQRRRVAIAGAIVPHPDLLFLDEPFIELDFPSIQTLLNRLDQLRNTGCTIILASHESHDIWPIVDQLVILSEGRILYHGLPEMGCALINPDNGLRPLDSLEMYTRSGRKTDGT